MENRVHEMSKNYEKMQKQINQLTNKLQLQKMGNTIIHNGNQINNSIQVLNHKETNYGFLTDRDYIKCIKSVNHCVKNLIEKVHFNDKHPENMNIYVPSMKTDYLMVYKDNIWSIVDRKKHLDLLYELNEVQLENWYDDCKHKYPDIIKSFNRYLLNKENSEILNEVKKEIIRLLYNKKKIVVQNTNNDAICSNEIPLSLENIAYE